jgi:exodeoxyribonuclease V alpha subunit
VILTAEQTRAVETALRSPVSVVTGGPGVGKTAVTRAILAALGPERTHIVAPTGKAAKRASEVCEHPAATIHRWAGANGASCEEPESVILDEASMIANDTLAMFLRAFRGRRLVLVGDCDQLPAIGAGNVLADLIGCGRVPVTRLTQIHRTGEGSSIAIHAANINAGKQTKEILHSSPDWRVKLPEDMGDLVGIADRAAEMVASMGAVFGVDPIRDVQVIACQHVEVVKLNDALRARLNPGAGGRFAPGDKVICRKNLYDIGAVNGDSGIVERFVGASATVRLFDGSVVVFEDDNLRALHQAWASAVHSSQGSEWPVVVHLLTPQSARVFGRACLYTAVTRARRAVVLITSPAAVHCAVGRNETKVRRTALGAMIGGTA